MLTQEERDLLKRFVAGEKADISPEQADIVLDALGKVHVEVAHFRRTYRVQCDGLGSLSTIHEEDALKRFDEWADKVQGVVGKNKNVPEVILFECCKGEDKPIKRYVATKD